MFVARDKDVLFELIKDNPYQTSYLKKRKGNSKLALIHTVLTREIAILKTALRFKPDLMIGTDIVITHIGKLLRIPSIVLNEDDAREIPFFTDYGIKYASQVLSPNSCDNSPFNYKMVGYSGYHELAYLHPKYFTPSKQKIDYLLDGQERYFIIRFSALSSHHDGGKSGITSQLAMKIIDLLKPYGKVYITSERSVEEQFEPYRININPRDIHHALYYADLYIGDSQTMTAEAAVLGTPGIRFNDFVGRLGYLEELEHTYQLTYGIKTDAPEELLQKIQELLALPNLSKEWKQRKRTYA